MKVWSSVSTTWAHAVLYKSVTKALRGCYASVAGVLREGYDESVTKECYKGVTRV
jgi:hypothetical protein